MTDCSTHDLAGTESAGGPTWSPDGNGQRFVVNAPIPSKVPPHFVVIVNWPAMMKK